MPSRAASWPGATTAHNISRFREVAALPGRLFISRLWRPRSNDSAGDGAVSFGISMATNAGVNVIREFLPDVTHHIFRRSANGR